MTIRVGEHPDTDRDGSTGHNKFLGLRGEGHRGVVLALRTDQRQAILLAKTASHDPEDGVVWGRLYLVDEEDAEHWPHVVKQVDSVPDSTEWRIGIP